MVTYNPKDWFKLIFHFHKTDTFRILLPTMLVLGILTTLTVFITQKFWSDYHPTLTMFHQISGFVISLVLVFRINTAYDRWWEGRRQWGTLVNVSRSFAIRIANLTTAEDFQKRAEFQLLIAAFAESLKDHLRNNASANILPEKFTGQHNWSHQPNFIVSQLDKECLAISKSSGEKHNEYLILSGYLAQMTDVCGACERIRNTPIPYSYSMFIKKIIFLYIITMPLAFGFSLGYWSVPMVMIIFYAFASLELLSEEIEDPFGTDDNDLPTDEIAGKIRENTKEILLKHESAV